MTCNAEIALHVLFPVSCPFSNFLVRVSHRAGPRSHGCFAFFFCARGGRRFRSNGDKSDMGNAEFLPGKKCEEWGFFVLPLGEFCCITNEVTWKWPAFGQVEWFGMPMSV